MFLGFIRECNCNDLKRATKVHVFFAVTYLELTVFHPELLNFIIFVDMVWRRLIAKESVHATKYTRIPCTKRESCEIKIVSFHSSKYCVL
jgi:hypothetical protein